MEKGIEQERESGQKSNGEDERNLESNLSIYSEKTQKDSEMFRESPAVYQTRTMQRVCTLKDYYALPDGHRAELIDGVIYDMAAPNNLHQQISMEIAAQLHTFIRKRNGQCKVAAAPTDVQLDCDEKTMIQPDLFVICDRSKILKTHIYGAPDFIIEILSPSTRWRDMNLKHAKYAAAGVREYWMIDPEKKKVVVYNLEQEELPTVYGFDSLVPVGIFEGMCEIDFKAIYDAVRFLYEL